MGKRRETHQRDHLTNEMFGVPVCAGREGSGAGAVDEEDFIQAFEDVPTVQVGRHLDSRTCVDFQHPIIFPFFFPTDLLQQGGGGGLDEDSRRLVRR